MSERSRNIGFSLKEEWRNTTKASLRESRLKIGEVAVLADLALQQELRARIELCQLDSEWGDEQTRELARKALLPMTIKLAGIEAIIAQKMNVPGYSQIMLTSALGFYKTIATKIRPEIISPIIEGANEFVPIRYKSARTNIAASVAISEAIRDEIAAN